MKIRLFWGGCALLSFLLLAAIGYAIHEQWEIYSKGNIVEVTITSLPNSLTTNGNLKFEFDGKIHSKSINGNTARLLHIGDKMQMKYLEGHQIFLYKDDNPVGWGLYVLIFLFVAGIFFIYYSLKKTPPSLRM